jgi:parallel beta-helix repeat protein
MTCRRPAIVLVAAGALLSSASTARAAAEFCVDSVAEFNAAYEVADEENVVIRVEQGTYDMAGSCLDGTVQCDIDDDMTIVGGYTDGCATRSGNAALTVFTHSANGGLVINTRGSFFSGNGDIALRGLTFRSIAGGVRLETEGSNNPDAIARLNQVWFDRTVLSVRNTAEVFIRNSMITRVGVDCALRIETNPADGGFLELVQLTHVTVARNVGRGICIGEPDSGRYRLKLVNSIAWGNTTDIALSASSGGIDVELFNNTYATLTNTTALVGDVSGTLSADPQFEDPAANDFELGGTSTSINSAFPLGDASTDKDLFGADRLFSSAADRGALESAIGSTAATLLVTNTNDTGVGSLRQAISDANQSANLNRIHFAIGSTCGPRVFNLLIPLPQITAPVIIDGYTQPGAARNTATTGNNGTLCIVLQQPAGSFANSAFLVTASADPTTSLRVDGIGFSNFLLGAITLGGGNGHAVVGSQFGGSVGAVDLLPSGWGVQTGAGVRGVVIGGPEPEDRNTITEALVAGISISAASAGESPDATIENNYIGLQRNGLTAEGNAKGITIRGSGNRVVGNTISSNAGAGIELDDATATDNLIESNRIGRTAALCFFDCLRGNGAQGIVVQDGALRNTLRFNEIWNSGSDGIAVTGADLTPIHQNTFNGNVGEPIDLGASGRTPNDNDSSAAPSGAGNRNQNYPVLGTPIGGDASGTVSGSLSSVDGWFRIDFHAADGCPPPLPQVTAEPRYHLGSLVVRITDASGGQDGTVQFTSAALRFGRDAAFFTQPRGIVATATRYSGDPDVGGTRLLTSELSTCRTYQNNGVLFGNGFE